MILPGMFSKSVLGLAKNMKSANQSKTNAKLAAARKREGSTSFQPGVGFVPTDPTKTNIPGVRPDYNNTIANTIPPVANITGNLTGNQTLQDTGRALWQGEEMASQFAQKQLDEPVPPPGDPIGDQLGKMFNQPFAQRKKGKKYTTGTGMDETDLEEGNFKSSRLGTYNNQYNIENVSNIQEDKKGQFMTTISDNESWDQSPRPKSSTVDNYNYKGVRDTLRPAKGKYFKMGWGENERNISRN